MRKVVNTTIYNTNRVQIRQGSGMTTYELWFGHTPTMKYFIIFQSKCYIKRDDYIVKFYYISDEWMFLDYSLKSKVCKYFNQRLKAIVESARGEDLVLGHPNFALIKTLCKNFKFLLVF